jgi:hypothetical protein
MSQSKLFRAMNAEIRLLGKTYLNFGARPFGNYTRRQMSAAAAYTIFCHAEFESFLEGWAVTFTDFADSNWKAKQATRPLTHLCTFHEGRKELSSVPSKDVWNEMVDKAIRQHRAVISQNNGIKESNVCKLLGPIGFDVTKIDTVLLADLSAFGTVRGDHAHQSHRLQIGKIFDPFDRQSKANALLTLLEDLDNELTSYLATC